MFALRGIIVSLALFCLLYLGSSALVAAGWRCLTRLRKLPARVLANLLFAVRILPLSISLLATLLLVAPSFALLEPHGTEEDISWAAVILGVCCLAFLIAAVIRVVHAQASTSRVVSCWLSGARALDVGTETPTFQAPEGIPPFMLAGVCRPRLLLSELALSLLTPDELKSAVRHEIAHMRYRDNLKKLALRLAWFPGMTKLDRAWQHAAELAADDAAVSNATEALDLAAALIKLSRQRQAEPLPAISVGLVDDGSLTERISRLLNWQDKGNRYSQASRWLLVPSLIALVLITATTYVPLLAQTHALTEWLVR